MTLVLLFALTANALTLLAESYSGCRFLPATARTDRDRGPLPPKSGRARACLNLRTHPYPVPSALSRHAALHRRIVLVTFY